MNFNAPNAADSAAILEKLNVKPGKIDLVMDTDAFNEIDDQFAIAYALRSPERINLRALYAAPFFNDLSDSPADGMEKSYHEIRRVLERMHDGRAQDAGFVFRGSDRYLPDADTPVESPAARDLVRRALEAEDVLYVAAIGAITNVASAILMEPKIVEKIVLIWLGGHPLYWPDTSEFNLRQDIHAARVVLDSGVPLVLIPCSGVTDHLTLSVPELECWLDGRSEIGTYLTENVRRALAKESGNFPGAARVIWDVTAIAYIIDPDWLPADVVPSPVLTDNVTWSADYRRHLVKVVRWVNRSSIFRDMIEKLSK